MSFKDVLTIIMFFSCLSAQIFALARSIEHAILAISVAILTLYLYIGELETEIKSCIDVYEDDD